METEGGMAFSVKYASSPLVAQGVVRMRLLYSAVSPSPAEAGMQPVGTFNVFTTVNEEPLLNSASEPSL